MEFIIDGRVVTSVDVDMAIVRYTKSKKKNS